MRFDDIVVGHAEWLARLSFRFCPRKEDAADLAQETLARILKNRDKFNAEMDFKPWVLTIMGNIFKTQAARRASVPFVPIDGHDDLATAQANHLAELNDLRRLIDRLSLKSESIDCVMLFAEGYDYKEIAEMKNVCVGTVKSRIANGRKAIAKALSDDDRIKLAR